jgi:hypothetical protein
MSRAGDQTAIADAVASLGPHETRERYEACNPPRPLVVDR